MSTTLTLLTAKVKWDGKNWDTKYGRASKTSAILPDGTEIQLWGNEDDPDILGLKAGQEVQVISVKEGKWKLANTTPKTATPNPSSGTGKTPTQLMTDDQKRFLKKYVTEQADLLAFCMEQAHKALVNKFPQQSFPVESEAVRSAGLSLYIAAQKRFSL